jgi:hypothetical protein
MSEHLLDRLKSTAHALKESRPYSASVVEDAIVEINRLRIALSETQREGRNAGALEDAAKAVDE